MSIASTAIGNKKTLFKWIGVFNGKQFMMKFNKYLKETSGLNPEIKSDVWKNTFTGETCTRWGKYWKTLISFSVGIFNNFIIKYNMIERKFTKNN